MLADFFSILLVRVRFRTRTARSFQGVLINQGERQFESIHRRGPGKMVQIHHGAATVSGE